MSDWLFMGSLLLLAVAAGALGFILGLAEGIESERKRPRMPRPPEVAL